MLYQQKYSYPNMAELVRKWIMSREQRIRESRGGNKLTSPALRNPRQHITGPNYSMPIDLYPELPPSDGYENIVIAMDVFYWDISAQPTTNQDAKTIAGININNIIKHAYLPSTVFFWQGIGFCVPSD